MDGEACFGPSVCTEDFTVGLIRSRECESEELQLDIQKLVESLEATEIGQAVLVIVLIFVVISVIAKTVQAVFAVEKAWLENRKLRRELSGALPDPTPGAVEETTISTVRWTKGKRTGFWIWIGLSTLAATYISASTEPISGLEVLIVVLLVGNVLLLVMCWVAVGLVAMIRETVATDERLMDFVWRDVKQRGLERRAPGSDAGE